MVNSWFIVSELQRLVCLNGVGKVNEWQVLLRELDASSKLLELDCRLAGLRERWPTTRTISNNRQNQDRQAGVSVRNPQNLSTLSLRSVQSVIFTTADRIEYLSNNLLHLQADWHDSLAKNVSSPILKTGPAQSAAGGHPPLPPHPLALPHYL